MAIRAGTAWDRMGSGPDSPERRSGFLLLRTRSSWRLYGTRLCGPVNPAGGITVSCCSVPISPIQSDPCVLLCPTSCSRFRTRNTCFSLSSDLTSQPSGRDYSIVLFGSDLPDTIRPMRVVVPDFVFSIPHTKYVFFTEFRSDQSTQRAGLQYRAVRFRSPRYNPTHACCCARLRVLDSAHEIRVFH